MRWTVLALCSSSIGMLAACSGAIAAEEDPSPQDASAEDAARPIDGAAEVLDAGASDGANDAQDSELRFSSDAKLVWERSGGFAPSSPPGSECDQYFDQYRYDRGARTLAWTFCVQNTTDAGPLNQWQEGTRALAADDVTAIETSLAALHLVEDPACTAGDGPRVTLSVQAADGGTLRYRDLTYCDGPPYVGGLEDVRMAMDAAANATR